MGRSKMLLGLTGATALVALLGGACGAAAQPTATPEAMMKKETPGAMMTKETPDAMMKKETPAAMMKKDLPPNLIAPHFVDSAPGHGQAFKQAPPAVVINFNFNLHEKSSLTVTRDGAAVAIGAVAIDPNKLTMRASLPAGSGDGLYVVGYKACWP
ncbi:MAG: copper resistance protein CopC, partial [Candidatus Sericytochromatia bacterium]|nr:copper resistance protein CopC [Candidatus Tanganyikabacteria bacterium]